MVYITVQYGLVAYVTNTTGAKIARGERESPEKQVPGSNFDWTTEDGGQNFSRLGWSVLLPP